VPRGCRLDDTLGASAECGCWTATEDEFFCEYLNPYGHACVDTAGCTPRETCAGAGGGCDTSRCDALPGGRYHDFVDELGDRRRVAGFSGGTFEDSICQAQYDATLLTIARTIVLSNCFNLEAPALGPETVELSLTRTFDDGARVDYVLPWFDATVPEATCSNCGSCPDGAFSLPTPTTVCLECGLLKQTGDSFVLTVLNEIEGEFEDTGLTP
jgi:hypothetical protein